MAVQEGLLTTRRTDNHQEVTVLLHVKTLMVETADVHIASHTEEVHVLTAVHRTEAAAAWAVEDSVEVEDLAAAVPVAEVVEDINI